MATKMEKERISILFVIFSYFYLLIINILNLQLFSFFLIFYF